MKWFTVSHGFIKCKKLTKLRFFLQYYNMLRNDLNELSISTNSFTYFEKMMSKFIFFFFLNRHVPLFTTSRKRFEVHRRVHLPFALASVAWLWVQVYWTPVQYPWFQKEWKTAATLQAKFLPFTQRKKVNDLVIFKLLIYQILLHSD